MPPAMAEQDGNAATPSALALFASRLSYHRYYAAAARLPQPTCRTQPRDLCDLFAHLSTSLPPPLTGCECAAGSGTRTSGCWRPRCPPALTSPRCSPRARRPGVCCKQARRRRSHSLRRVQCWMVGAASSSPTSSHAPSRSLAMSRSAPNEISAWRVRCADYALLLLVRAPALPGVLL